MRMTMAQFEAGLATRRGSFFATLVTRTRPALLKKNRETKEPCPWPLGVEHLAVRPVTLGAMYENSVNLQRTREGNDEAFCSAALWPSKEYPDGAGQRDGPYTVCHRGTGKRYFAVRARADGEGHAVSFADRWTDVATGEAIHPDDLAPYLPAPSSSSRQEVDRPVPWRTVELANVLEIRTYGEIFDIVPEPARRTAPGPEPVPLRP